MTQSEFIEIKKDYENNFQFHDYVEEYRRIRGLTIWDALTYQTVVEEWRDKYRDS